MVQDGNAEDEVIAEDMDLGRMHHNDDDRCATKDVIDFLGLVVAELIDGARAGS